MSSRRVFNIYANWDCMCNTWKYLHKPTLSFLPCQLESSTTKLRAMLLQSKSQGWSLEDTSVMQSTQPVRSLNCKQKESYNKWERLIRSFTENIKECRETRNRKAPVNKKIIFQETMQSTSFQNLTQHIISSITKWDCLANFCNNKLA